MLINSCETAFIFICKHLPYGKDFNTALGVTAIRQEGQAPVELAV
jgi:hypothetical protein